MKIELDIDEKLLTQANSVLENVDRDIQTIIKFLLTQIVKEGSIIFLFSQNAPEASRVLKEQENNSNVNEPFNFKMTKSRDKRLFESAEIKITDKVTFASKNRAVANYWANPRFDMLSLKWHLILHDYLNCKLFLFCIPDNSIQKTELSARTDDPKRMHIEIRYKDSAFTDRKSPSRQYSFRKFLVDEFQY